MSGNEELQVRAGLNAGLVTATVGMQLESAKALLLQPVSAADSLIVEGVSDEIRGVFGVVVNVRNTAGFDVDVSLVFVRADGAEIKKTSTVPDGDVQGLELSGPNTLALAPGDKVVLRVAKTGGGGDVTTGVVALASWAVFNKFTLTASHVLSDSKVSVVTIPPGVFADVGTVLEGSGLIVKNYDDVNHEINLYLNTGSGPDVLIDVFTVTTGALRNSDMVFSEIGVAGLAPGWTVKIQMSEPVSTVAPDAVFVAVRRDSHDD